MSGMMSEQAKKFSVSDFNPEKYVKEISQVCIGGQELIQHKSKIQALSEETSQALKKNVYRNYMQFIETAREISHLEGEMYQLSHLLGDQRILLAGMGNATQQGCQLVEGDDEDDDGPAGEDAEEKRVARLEAIAEKVEGCISLQDAVGRDLVHEGDLVELEPLENTALHRCHAFLFTDLLIIATWISNRRGPAKYKFEASYDMRSLAVVNVRDLGSVKHAFKLLVFPDTRLFQCANNQAKEDWLEKLEQVKRARLSTEQSKREKLVPTAEQKSPVRTESIDSGSNPFGWGEDKESACEEDRTPEWVSQCPEDLDVFIAQRHFEDAFALATKALAHLDNAKRTPNSHDIKGKVEARMEALTQVLLSELSATDRSLQGGLRASRRPVRLLNQLGKSNQACQLYLKLCTSVLKAQMKRVKREGATTAYVRRLSGVFFTNMAATTTEFQHRAFPSAPSCSSAFVVWASMEVSHFTTHLIKQIFMVQTPLSVLAESVDIVRKQCQQLTELGLDLSYQVEGQLSTPVCRALTDTRDKLVDAVKLRCSEDTWQHSQHGKPALHKLLEEFAAAGLGSVGPYVTGDGWLELTVNTVCFVRLYSALLEDSLTLSCRDTEHTMASVLYDVFNAQLRHVAASLASDALQAQRALIQKNAMFLIDAVLKTCSEKYARRTGHRCDRLQRLGTEYSPLLKDTVVRTVTGYI